MPLQPVPLPERSPGPQPTEPVADAPEELPGSVVADLVADDDTQLVGLVFGEGRRRGVVLVHPEDGGSSVWYPFASRLLDAGYAALAFDLRGHGFSKGGRDPARYPLDVMEAIAFLLDTGSEEVAVVGAGAGGTAAVAGVARSEDPVRALAVVGGGPVAGGLDATRDARRLRGTRVLVLTVGDEGERLARLVRGAALERAPSADPTDPRLQDVLLRFLRGALG